MKKQLAIHSENILPIIKKWLYSEHDIFVRELISNSCDAIQKVKLLRDQGKVQANDEDFRIDVKIDKEKKTITFSDNGIGMDADEVEKYIAQIAFSGAEDFVAKYKTGTEKDQFIGHFGLGFYSSYMVSDKVEVNTLSYKEGSEPVLWICDGSAEYVLEKGSRDKRGTDITLYVNKESEEFLEESRLKHVLKHYCSFLPFPIYLGDERINPDEPLWMKPPSECTEADYLKFYNVISPYSEEPLFWVHLNVDYPFHLKGILYFPKIQKDFDFNKSTIQLYCNRVFVSDNCKDIVPEYLNALKGVIDSPDIPLNVSRSSLQMDKTVRQLSSHISKKVCDSLNNLFKNDRTKFLSIWEDLSTFVKLGLVQDDKFYERVKDILLFKDIQGEWVTVPEYQAAHQEKVYYTTHENHHEGLIDAFKDKGILVLKHPLDPYVISVLERQNTSLKFQRIDAEIEDHLIDKEREKTVLDDQGRTEGAKISQFFKSEVGDDKLEVEAKSLKNDSMSAFIVIEENERRFRDYMLRMDPSKTKDALKGIKRKMVVNTNSPLIGTIGKLKDKHPEIASELAKEVYSLALLTQREMDESDLNAFVSRTTKLLEELAKLGV